MKQNDYRTNRQWSDGFLSQVRDIIANHAGVIISVEVAPDELDRTEATDMLVVIKGGSVAVRARRASINFRDLTIRSKIDGANRTELDKIRNGFVDWYLYCWTKDDIISEWMLVDMNSVRKKGLLNKERRQLDNGDGTHFIAISRQELGDSIVVQHGL